MHTWSKLHTGAIQSFGLHKGAIQWIGLHTWFKCNVLVDVTKKSPDHTPSLLALYGYTAWSCQGIKRTFFLRRKSWIFAKWDIESRLCYACNLRTATQQMALEQRTALMVSMRIAEKQQKICKTSARSFAKFAVVYRFLPVLPATDRELAAFVSFQSQSCTHDTILGHLSHIRDLHLRNGYQLQPTATHWLVQSAVIGIRRTFDTPKRNN